jgi:hypothetical protein
MSPFQIQLKLLIFPLLLSVIYSQLTIQDKENIEKFILQGQSKNTGLFFEEESNTNKYRNTKEAISVLKTLGLEVKHKKEICKKISEVKEVDVNIVSINKLFDCKIDFKNFKPDLNKGKLLDLYNEAQIMDTLKIDQWKDLFKKVKNFMVQENGKFSAFKIKDNKKKSLLATAIGVELLSLIGSKSEDLKSEVLPLLKKSVDTIMKNYAEVSENMIVFLEKNIDTYRLNYHVISGTKAAKKLGVEIPLFNNNLYKLLNYFNTFKYEMITHIDNTYFLLQIYKLLEKIPLMQINKDSFNYLSENNVKINFENIFGEKLQIKNTTITIEISENKDKNPKTGAAKESKKKSSYDLDDDESEDTKSNLGAKKKEIKISSPKTEAEFDLSAMIKGPGYFTLSIDMDNKIYGLKENKKKVIRSYSEVKIESIDFEIIDKIKDQNNQHLPLLKNPQKLSQVLKANQDCSLIGRVKVSFPKSKKPTLMEQVFLRLKNVELQKSYNAYASKFDLENNEYFIGFELDDPVNMESYNGIYEISVVMSDPTIKNVLQWDFGKIQISFTKPSDPLDEQRALKNKLQPKMEPTFQPEVKREKNLVVGTIFSFIILFLTLLLFVVLVKSESNVNNFPKSSFAFLMNVMFIGVLGVVAYVLFLFWTKFNILQTMFFFVLMFIPASFIVYKALKNHKIEIVVERDED